MSEFNRIFSDLKSYFATHIKWTHVEDYLSEYESEEETQRKSCEFWALPMCTQNPQDQDQQLQALRELSNCIRSLRCTDIVNHSGYDITFDNWSEIVDISPVDYLAYIYALVSLATLPQHTINAAIAPINTKANIQLSLNAVSTYLLTLTIPGAKSYGVFDEGVIEHCLKTFRLLEHQPNSDVHSNTMSIQFLSICDDLKLVFRYVHFKDHRKPRDDIIKCLLQLVYNSFRKGYTNACANQMHLRCFEIFDEIANEHNGDVLETLMLIMSQSFHMHSFPENVKPGIGHISDWFVGLLDKYPDIITEVLGKYIECVITNPIREWKAVDEKVAIFYAAKYDAALYAKCNKSCSDFLKDSIKADDAVGIQIRTLELIERILQQETHVEWSIFRHDVSTKPREVTLIAETIKSLDDRTFTVRRKASQVLNISLKQGSPTTVRILNECLNFVQYGDESSGLNHRARQLSMEIPGVLHYAYSFEGYEELEPLVKKMPKIIYERFIDSNNGLARCSGIALLERLVLTNQRIIYDTNFEREFAYFAVDALSSVRKAALESLDTMLQSYCNCTILIGLYCRIWPCLLSDEDIALQKLAMHSFNRIVLLNIKPLEYINEPRNRLPWRILATLLAVQPRNYLQERLTLLLQSENFVTPQLVNTIISYLPTSMATEAWALLVFISSRITNNLDALITTFNSLSSYNMKSNQLLALELIIYCLRNFSKSALNRLFTRLLSALRSGSIWLALVTPAVHVLNHIDRLSHSQAPQDGNHVENWQMQLLQDVTEAILKSMNHFQDEHIAMASLLGTYTELISKSPQQRVDNQIIKFVVKYLQLCVQLKESSFDTDNERNLNWMVVIAGRLSLRDHHLAHRLSGIYGQILSKNDRPQLINSTLIGMNDLGKKYPSILEINMKCILIKLYSKFATTRVRTYRCVKDVILAGNIKLKGPILISLLAGLVDESAEVAREADAFFIRYKKLYDKMLFHHCLKECPFDFNDQAFLKGSQRLDASFKSRLKGAGRAKSRRLIYNHIIASLDENTLLLYFGQLKLLAEKTKDEEFITSSGALDVVIDMLFIMRRICSCTKSKGQQSGTQTEGGNDEAAGEEEPLPTPVEQQPTTSSASTAPAKGRGRGRARDNGEEPLKQLERCLRYVPETHNNLSMVMNSELRLEFDKFCRAMTMRFPNYTDFAQPAKFWQKYKQSKSSGKPKAKRRRLNDGSFDADNYDDQSCSENSEGDSDDEMPLDRHTLTNATVGDVQRGGGFDVLATELIFQQHE
ncbi:hypothetical protein KR093_002837 [Drosophila rubida]|uniref:Condensin-2 complex subunit n=1 Tax=Drosophila rubida TaxID=30044 RepID=A0AAD4PMI0_9MUSC|nr:hypothetical protein KR093_002837 [Drosophila rubida]